MNLSSIIYLFRSPDSLALYGIPYELRPGQSPKDLWHARGEYLDAPRGWIWLGTPGWFGSMSSEAISNVKVFLAIHREDIPGNPYEWSRIAPRETFPFDRVAIADAYVALARHDGCIARRLRECPRTRDLSGQGYMHRESVWETLDSFDDDMAREHFFRLYEREVGTAEAKQLRADYARIGEVDGVEIVVESSDDDPTRITFHISDRVAAAWADRHGSLCGGTWEQADGPDFVYDVATWHPTLIDELEEEGYNLNLTAYYELEDEDLRTVDHMNECEECQDHWDFRKAEAHLEALDELGESEEREEASKVKEMDLVSAYPASLVEEGRRYVGVEKSAERGSRVRVSVRRVNGLTACYGIVTLVRDASGLDVPEERIATTRDYPHGCDGLARDAARVICLERGWIELEVPS